MIDLIGYILPSSGFRSSSRSALLAQRTPSVKLSIISTSGDSYIYFCVILICILLNYQSNLIFFRRFKKLYIAFVASFRISLHRLSPARHTNLTLRRRNVPDMLLHLWNHRAIFVFYLIYIHQTHT